MAAIRDWSVRASGVVWMPGGGEAAFDAGGADVDGAVAEAFPDLASEAGDAGLAVGPCDGDHGLGAGAEPEGGGVGERGAGVLGDDEGDVGRGEGVSGEVRALAVGQDGRRPVSDGARDEARAVDLRAGERCEKRAGVYLAAVDGEPCYGRIGAAHGGQAQFGEGFCGLRHPWPRPGGLVWRSTGASV
jgi:hypothetical protein